MEKAQWGQCRLPACAATEILRAPAAGVVPAVSVTLHPKADAAPAAIQAAVLSLPTSRPDVQATVAAGAGGAAGTQGLRPRAVTVLHLCPPTLPGTAAFPHVRLPPPAKAGASPPRNGHPLRLAAAIRSLFD